MMGIFLLGVAALSISGYLDIGLLLEGKYLLVFAVGMAIIGLLDTLTAIVIARWR